MQYLQVDKISPNPHQPRRQFQQAALEQLAQSIKNDGLMQPVIVRPLAAGKFELVAGERRWRAAQLAGLTQIPALVKELDDEQTAQWALVENLQREDLNPMERAEAFQKLSQKFSLSHDQIAQRVGVDRSTITNTLRLLNLHRDLQALVTDGRLSAGHARALVAVADPQQQLMLGKRAIAQDWSVRKLEQVIRDGQDISGKSKTSKTKARGHHLQDLEEQLSSQLSTRVHIRPGRRKGSGTLAIDFRSLEEFDALLARMNVKTDAL